MQTYDDLIERYYDYVLGANGKTKDQLPAFERSLMAIHPDLPDLIWNDTCPWGETDLKKSADHDLLRSRLYPDDLR